MRRPSSRALLALLLVAPAPSLGAAAALWWWPGTVGNALYAAGKLVLYGLPFAWRVLVDRERPSLSPARAGGFRVGVASGLAIGALVVLAFLALEPRIDPSPLRAVLRDAGLHEPRRYALYGLYLATGNAALEEYAFRWFLYTRLRALLPEASAVVAAALLFTAHHVIVLAAYFETWVVALASAGVFAGGLAWSWCYARYRSVWPGWASHALVDVAVLAVGWRLLFGT